MAKKHYAKSNDAIQNAAKTLLANIRFAGMDAPIRSIVITSSAPDEGKSTVALNLASAIATSGKSCLLVETDMRRRTLAGRVGVHAKAGIFAVLSEQAKLADAAMPLRPEGLFLLDAEPSIPSPSDLLASKRFARLHDAMCETYDYVIFDTPPVGAFVDAAVLASLADATVLVVREGQTRRDDLVRATEQLKKADANLIGVCMNDCDYQGHSYYYEHYYSKGKAGSDHAASRASGASARKSEAAPAGGKRFAK